MSHNSQLAHEEIKQYKPTLKQKVLQCVKDQSRTLHQVAEILDMRIQTASARLSELNDDGLVRIRNGKYETTPPEWEKYESNYRLNKKYQKWKKVGLENGWLKDASKTNVQPDSNKANQLSLLDAI